MKPVFSKKVTVMKRGDRIARIAQPIAGAIDGILGTNIKNCEGCKESQRNLNEGMSVGKALRKRFLKRKN